tara:strand:+ start:51 stop:1448 length:1398 start_codon:yes stop_codon:yes gene_type:complete
MSDYYETTERLKIDSKRVMIFTLKSSATKVWYVRIRRKHGTGYFQKSLKTTSRDSARESAKKLYMEMWNTESKGVKFVDSRFNDLFRDFLEHSQLGKHRFIRARGVYNRYFSEFFGSTPISQIDTKMFNEYLRWRCEYWTEKEKSGFLEDEQLSGKPTFHYAKIPSETTLKSERQIFKQFLYYCAENRYIDTVPHLKSNLSKVRGVKYRSERQKAKALTKSQEERIERLLRKYCLTDGQKDKNWIRQFGRARLYYFIYLCKHTLIRPSTEATALKWRDIEIKPSRKFTRPDGTPYPLALINVRESKTGKPRMTVMPYGQVPLITRWRQMSKEWGFGLPEDYVFPNHKGSRIESHLIGRLLRDKLALWGEHRTEDGKVVTLYSLARHTAITRRIERSDWDVGQVATAAGTSIKQISSFYYEAFVSANPDRWAVTFKSGVPVLSDKKNQEVDDELAKWEAMVDDMKM